MLCVGWVGFEPYPPPYHLPNLVTRPTTTTLLSFPVCQYKNTSISHMLGGARVADGEQHETKVESSEADGTVLVWNPDIVPRGRTMIVRFLRHVLREYSLIQRGI